MLFFEKLLKYGAYLIDCYLLFQLPPPAPEVDNSELASNQNSSLEITGNSSGYINLGKFPCDLCTDIFSSETNLMTHQELKHDMSFLNNTNPKITDGLSKDFKKSKSDMEESIQEIKIIEKEEIINKESKKITGMPEKSLVNHNLDLEHDCALCTEEFKSEEDLRMHIKMLHHFPCRFCSKTFSGIKFLESHLKVCNEKIENGNIKQKTDCEIEVDIQIPELGGDNNGVFHHDL